LVFRERASSSLIVSYIDFILNLVALLVWLSWRSRRIDPLLRTSPATLIGTLKRTDARRFSGWQLCAGLLLLLVVRAWFYWLIGAPVNWTPKLSLGLVSLAFRSDSLVLALLYSSFSFARFLVVFYFWLVVLVVINRRALEADAVQKLLRLHIGRISRWPAVIQILLPLLFVIALWAAIYPLLVHIALLTRITSFARLLLQGFLVGLGLFSSLKYLLPPLLLLHLVCSYVYLGNHPVWEFVSVTAQNLLAPLRKIPLRFARFDLTPLAGLVLILLALQWLPSFLIGKMAQWKLSAWPQ
jgi:uncharacterized protein YggT (Ycf19 family)